MRIILPFLILLIIGCSNQKKINEINSQSKSDFEEYKELTWNAMLHFKDEEFDKSLKKFQQAFKIIPDQNVSDYFFASASALNLSKNKIAKELIIQAIKKTNASENYFDSFNEFNSFRDNGFFNEIKQNYAKYQSDFYKGLKHPQIYREIDSLMKIDKKMRTNGSEWKDISRVDSLNITRLIEITKKYGWQDKGWLILWHQRGTYGKDNYVWNFFKPYIDNQISKGTMRKTFWTNFDEEKSITTKKEQIYGLYSSQFDLYPIVDIKNVDKRRTKNGLPPLWYLEKVYGIDLPKEYEKTMHKVVYKK